MIWVWLGLWLPTTLFVHILVHEGAHAICARSLGAQGVRIRPYPHFADGGFWWGRTTWSSWRATPQQELVTLAAPVIAECVWIILALAAAFSSRWALFELVALVDVGTWFLGAIRKRAGTDGGRVRELLK